MVVNQPQRLVLLAAMVMTLWQVVEIAAPFHHGRRQCDPPAIEAFRTPPPRTGIAAYLPEANLCTRPARRQLWRSGVLVGVVAVGTAGALRLLRDPEAEARS